MPVSRRLRITLFLITPENWWWISVSFVVSAIAVVMADGYLRRQLPLSKYVPCVAIPMLTCLLVWAIIQRQKRRDAQLNPLGEAMTAFARRLQEMPLDEARKRSQPLIELAQREPHTSNPEAECLHWQKDLHPSVIELFDRFGTISWGQHARIGRRWVGPSRLCPGFIRIGTMREDFSVELALKPNSPEVYEVDLVNAQTHYFNEKTRFPSIYHWMIFLCQHHTCPHCSYDLRQTPTRCPECGTEFPWNISFDAQPIAAARVGDASARSNGTSTTQ